MNDHIPQDYSGVIQGYEDNPQIAGVSGALDMPILMPLKNWDLHRPIHELQNKGYETSACTLFSGTDCAETLGNFHLNRGNIPQVTLDFLNKYGYIVDGSFNFSDRLPANFAEIIPLTGTYQFKANASMVKYLIPEKMLPYTAVGEYKNPDPTKGAYFNRDEITPAMLRLAEEFCEHITINWNYVEDKSRGLMTSPLQAIVRYADGAGVLKPIGRTNHAIMVYGEEDDGTVDLIDDSYSARDKKYGAEFVYDFIFYTFTFNKAINMDTQKFLQENNLKWLRNEKTGQFGRVIKGKLRPITSADRGALILLDDKVRGNKAIIDGKEASPSISDSLWITLPKLNF